MRLMHATAVVFARRVLAVCHVAVLCGISLGAIAAGTPAAASIIHFDFAAPTPDTTLQLGETVSLYIEVTGLETGDQLDSLAATVSIEGNIFGPPVIRPGGIVPSTLEDPLDLLVDTARDQADVAFLTFSTEPDKQVRTNGTFYTLDLVAEQLGNGTVSFEFVGATQFNTAAPDLPFQLATTAGQALTFQVVPEPASFAWIPAATAAMLFALRRRSP